MDGRVSGNHNVHKPSLKLDFQGQGGHIEENNIQTGLCLLTSQDGSLHGSTVSDGFIEMDGWTR
jgi:hypothetical protein